MKTEFFGYEQIVNHDGLQERILSLIETKREGDFWDFKLEHHENRADLLHDILCMANSLNDKDCFIILGVEDQTGIICGVEKNSTRRSQQQLIDFLKSKEFCGDYRPIVELHTFIIENHDVDVITVLNTMNTPYYLKKDR